MLLNFQCYSRDYSNQISEHFHLRVRLEAICLYQKQTILRSGKEADKTQVDKKPIFFEPEFLPFEKNRSWSDSNQGPFPSQVYSLSLG